MIKTITLDELCAMRSRGDAFELIDVRTPAEFRATQIAFARNVPLESFDPHAVLQDRRDQAAGLVFACRTGRRARSAAERVAGCGVDQVMVLDAHIDDWEAAGLPVVHGKNIISLERQTRIAIGSMVVIGAVLGVFLHPALVWLSVAAGMGLVFAGITDRCPLAMTLARAPWNQVASER